MAGNIGLGSSLKSIKTGSMVLTDEDISKNFSAIDNSLKKIWTSLIDLNKRIVILESKKLV